MKKNARLAVSNLTVPNHTDGIPAILTLASLPGRSRLESKRQSGGPYPDGRII